MNAILIFTGWMGFACLPPPNVAIGPLPFTGPFAMSLDVAQHRAAALPEFNLEVIRDDDPNYAEIVSRCPSIFH